ncbi:hypothetical protein AUP68_10107 [Ilyonectria robusta]
MATPYDQSPEVAPPSDAPEVYHPPINGSQSHLKPDDYGYHLPNYNPTAGSTYGSTLQYQPAPSSAGGKGGKRFTCGCSLVVLILSIIIAVLSAAVIGLAAGTGIATSNYNNANQKLEALSSSYASIMTVTASSAPATPTSYSDITNGCSDTDETTTGQTYTSQFFNNATYTMYCNRDAANAPLFSLFTGNFDGCMEACTAWNNFNSTNANTCRAVSFIPLWTNITVARNGNAAGDCFLKPKPQRKADLTTPNIGTECHAAIHN